MKKLSNTEAKLKNSVAYKKSVYFIGKLQAEISIHKRFRRKLLT